MAPTDKQDPKIGSMRRGGLRSMMVVLASCWTAGLVGLAQTAGGALPITAPDKHHTVIGFIYSPGVLADLLAQKSDGEGSLMMAAAVDQKTPVVAMWTEPVPAEVGPSPLPSQWRIAVLPSGNFFGADKIEPLWIKHDLTAFAPLASSLRQPFVGAIAAFPQGALSKGRRICLYAEYPPDYEKKNARSITRCADL